MLKKLMNTKLKHQLSLLVAIALVMMILALVFYYISFLDLTKKRAAVYFDGIVSQMEGKLSDNIKETENVTKTLTTSYNLQKYLLEENDSQKFSYLGFVLDSINYTIACSNSIQGIKIIDRYGNQINSGSGYNMLIYNQIINDYKLKSGECTSSYFTKSYRDSGNEKVYYAYVCPVYAVLQGEFSKSNIAVCIVLCNSDLIKGSMKDLYGIPGFIYRISEGELTISTNAPVNMATKLADADKSKEPEYLYMTYSLEQTGWKIDSMVKISDLTSDMRPMLSRGFLIVFVTIIMLMAIGIIFSRSITVPITRIVGDIRSIDNEDTKYRIRIPSINEIGSIAKEINMMLDKIDNYTSKIIDTQQSLYLADLERKKAELLFIQNQINPHFLYNSLECIRSIAYSYKIDEIACIASSMAKMFRYSVREGNIVTIKNEIDCVRDYFNVMSIRYAGKFKLKICVPNELMMHIMLKMSLQPIIENSILHGFAMKKKDAYVSIIGLISDSGITLVVADNGSGMSPQQVQAINFKLQDMASLTISENSNRSSLGLANINRRIKMNYGLDFGIHVTSKEGFYTAVHVHIPLL